MINSKSIDYHTMAKIEELHVMLRGQNKRKRNDDVQKTRSREMVPMGGRAPTVRRKNSRKNSDDKKNNKLFHKLCKLTEQICKRILITN